MATKASAPNPNPQPTMTTQPSLLPRKATIPLSPRAEFWLDWTLKTLAVAAAIVFGIWAPISYNATLAGNADNNSSQESVASRLSAMSDQATNAARLQGSAISEMRSVGSAVDELRSRMDGVAVMSAFEFCAGEGVSSLSACRALSRSVDLDELISRVASGFGSTTTPGATTASRPTASPTSDATLAPTFSTRTTLETSTNGPPTPGAQPSSTPSGSPEPSVPPNKKKNLGAILGGTFGGILIIGLLIPCFFSHRR